MRDNQILWYCQTIVWVWFWFLIILHTSLSNIGLLYKKTVIYQNKCFLWLARGVCPNCWWTLSITFILKFSGKITFFSPFGNFKTQSIFINQLWQIHFQFDLFISNFIKINKINQFERQFNLFNRNQFSGQIVSY